MTREHMRALAREILAQGEADIADLDRRAEQAHAAGQNRHAEHLRGFAVRRRAAFGHLRTAADNLP